MRLHDRLQCGCMMHFTNLKKGICIWPPTSRRESRGGGVAPTPSVNHDQEMNFANNLIHYENNIIHSQPTVSCGNSAQLAVNFRV